MVLLFAQCEKELDPNDPVNIPDQNFLNALIEDGVDTNGDGLISYGEAQVVTTIDLDPDSVSVSKGKISSLEGLEAFINLEYLHCCSNRIQEFDVSENKELKVLVCWNHVGSNIQLLSLNVSKNTKLETISITGSQITNLDVSNCPSLHELILWYNQITNLDVSKNTKLSWLGLDGNLLSRLDISNNINLGPALGLSDMPTLSEVCVWTMPFPPEGLYIDTIGSPNVYFTTDCNQ